MYTIVFRTLKKHKQKNASYFYDFFKRSKIEKNI